MSSSKAIQHACEAVLGALLFLGSWCAYGDLLDMPVSSSPTPSPSPDSATSLEPAPQPAVPQPGVNSGGLPGKGADRGASGNAGLAKGDGAREEVQWKADSVSASRDSGRIDLHRNVVVVQGPMKMESDHGIILSDPATRAVVSITATGNVRMSKYDVDPKERVRARSKEAFYDYRARTVTLKGEPNLWHGGDVVRGREIRYELDTGLIHAERVEGVVAPETRGKGPAKSTDEDAEGTSPSGKGA